VNADKIRIWIARFAAPLAFFFAATVLVILVQRALESDDGEAGTNTGSTVEVDTGETTTEAGPTTALPRGCRRQRYIVKSGDTLESIAARCDVSLSDLLELNPNIDPLALNPGDRIRIRPAPAPEDEQGTGTETQTETGG
jgi:LysM repeat protein